MRRHLARTCIIRVNIPGLDCHCCLLRPSLISTTCLSSHWMLPATLGSTPQRQAYKNGALLSIVGTDFNQCSAGLQTNSAAAGVGNGGSIYYYVSAWAIVRLKSRACPALGFTVPDEVPCMHVRTHARTRPRTHARRTQRTQAHAHTPPLRLRPTAPPR